MRRVTLTENDVGSFECRWVNLLPNRSAAAGYLAKLDDLITCPIAHGEGNFQVSERWPHWLRWNQKGASPFVTSVPTVRPQTVHALITPTAPLQT